MDPLEMNPPKVTNAHSKVQTRVYFFYYGPASVIKWSNVDDKQPLLSSLTPAPVQAHLQLVFT